MKKIFLILCICFLICGCGKYSDTDAQKDLEKKLENLKAYNLTGEMEIVNNDDVYKYDVEASFLKNDKFRVSLKNKTNNHEQIILKNSDGVYVLTPTLNKSFKFQSDWPYNNSQVYLMQTLLADIQNDNKRKFKEANGNYIFTTKVNYPNNSDLSYQNIYFDKKLNPVKVEVMNEDGDALIKMNFNKVNFKANFKNSYFTLDENMKVAKENTSLDAVSKTLDEIYPMYIPDNTKLSSKDTVDLDNGQRVIMTFEGDNPFMFVQQTASVSDDLTIESIYGEPCQMASGLCAVSDNMVSWVNNGTEYYVVASNMSSSELISVANSVAVLPVAK